MGLLICVNLVGIHDFEMKVNALLRVKQHAKGRLLCAIHKQAERHI